MWQLHPSQLLLPHLVSSLSGKLMETGTCPTDREETRSTRGLDFALLETSLLRGKIPPRECFKYFVNYSITLTQISNGMQNKTSFIVIPKTVGEEHCNSGHKITRFVHIRLPLFSIELKQTLSPQPKA